MLLHSFHTHLADLGSEFFVANRFGAKFFGEVKKNVNKHEIVFQRANKTWWVLEGVSQSTIASLVVFLRLGAFFTKPQLPKKSSSPNISSWTNFQTNSETPKHLRSASFSWNKKTKFYFRTKKFNSILARCVGYVPNPRFLHF